MYIKFLEMMKLYKNLLISLISFSVLSYLAYFYFRLGDDTYIYLRYAQNVLNNFEFSFNPGHPSYGFTGPFWLFVIVFIGFFSPVLEYVPTIASFLFSIGTIIVWYKIIRLIYTDNILIMLSLILIIIDPNLMKHAYLGMEASASYFFSSILILYFIKNNIERNDFFIIGIIIGLFYLTRPESIIFSFLIIVAIFLRNKITFVNALVLLSLSGIIALTWHFAAYFFTGSILPATYAAKGGGINVGVRFVPHIFDGLKLLSGGYIIHLLILGFSIFRQKKINSDIILLIFILFIYLLFYSLTLNNEILYSRYFSIFIPLLNLVVIKSFREFDSVKNVKFLSGAMILILLFSLTTGLLKKDFYLFSEKTEDEIIEWVNQNTEKTDKIIRARIGKIGYKTERYIVDPVGIINPEIIKNKVDNMESDFYKLIEPKYYIGNAKYTIEQLSRYYTLEKIKTFESGNLLLRAYFTEEVNKAYEVFIFRLHSK